MDILWITNIPVGRSVELMDRPQKYISGTWLDAALSDFINDGDFRVTIVTVTKTNAIKMISDGNINYCLLPGGGPDSYDISDQSNFKSWKYIQNTFRPDIIHVWGTEFKHGYLALKAMKGLPSVVYMQGVLAAISRYYRAGMTPHELRSNITFRDIIRRDWIVRKQRNLAKNALIEAEMLHISNNVIVENKWCTSYCKSINPGVKVHQCNLNIRHSFFQAGWKFESAGSYTILCNAGGYPIKGLHVLIRALKIVSKRFPTVQLMIPGEQSPFSKGLVHSIKENGYTRFIKKLIIELDLINNIQYLGPLDSSQMAERMSTANVFVMSSCIENHSSTLMEAMIVGTPCIAAYAGGVPEYLHHQENGLLYRFEEHEMLAEHICDLFSDPQRAISLGTMASKTMRASRLAQDHKGRLVEIYRKVIGSEK